MKSVRTLFRFGIVGTSVSISVASLIAGCNGTYFPGGNPTPTPRPTATPTPRPSGNPTPTPSPTPIGNPTPSPSPSPSPGPTPTPSPTPTPAGNGPLIDLGTTVSSDTFSDAFAVNADGSVVGGTSGNFVDSFAPVPRDAFRWSSSGGLQNLGVVLSGGYQSGAIYAFSDNGQSAVGQSSASNFTAYQSFILLPSGASFIPVPFAGAYTRVQALGTSSDASVTVGSLGGPGGLQRGFRWAGGSQTILDDLSGGSTTGSATAVSANGNVIVGYGNNASGINEACRWVNFSVSGLGFLPGYGSSRASGVSSDGSVIVGDSNNSSGTDQAFRWESGAMVGLGFLPGRTSSTAYGVSGDGRVVVGIASGGGSDAFVWTAAGGMRNLKDVLAARGVDVSNWSVLNHANAISRDGTTIVGGGLLRTGQARAFRAYSATGW